MKPEFGKLTYNVDARGLEAAAAVAGDKAEAAIRAYLQQQSDKGRRNLSRALMYPGVSPT